MKKVKEFQIVLFSATFNDRVTTFATRFAPGANEIRLKKEEVSLDAIKQFFMGALRAPSLGSGSPADLAGRRLLRRDPKVRGLGRAVQPLDRRAEHHFLPSQCPHMATLLQLLTFSRPPQQRKTSDDIAARMTAEGHKVTSLHGALEVAERDAVMDSFRDGKTKVLITTNVLARGIDVMQVNMVVNYDLPVDGNGRPDPETYIHRIGQLRSFRRVQCFTR